MATESGAWFDTFPDEEGDPDTDSAVLREICTFIGLPDGVSYGELLYRLADLIDCPNCCARVVRGDE